LIWIIRYWCFVDIAVEEGGDTTVVGQEVVVEVAEDVPLEEGGALLGFGSQWLIGRVTIVVGGI
jgi:hypothetical protein